MGRVSAAKVTQRPQHQSQSIPDDVFCIAEVTPVSAGSSTRALPTGLLFTLRGHPGLVPTEGWVSSPAFGQGELHG